MYQLKTEADFDSAHFLSGYTGKCSNIHGHRWHVEIEIESRKLEKNGQERGMLVDFGDLKKDLKELADSMDHTLIYEENTLRPKTLEALDEEGFHLVKVPFRPTAENFSEYFFRKMEEKGYLQKIASEEDGRVTYITVTKKGSELSQKYDEQYFDSLLPYMEEIPDEDAECMIQTIEKFYQIMCERRKHYDER